jgi:hypothetical protein
MKSLILALLLAAPLRAEVIDYRPWEWGPPPTTAELQERGANRILLGSLLLIGSLAAGNNASIQRSYGNDHTANKYAGVKAVSMLAGGIILAVGFSMRFQ